MLVIWKPINSVIQQFVALFLFLGFYAFYQKFNFAELISNGGLTLFTISTLSTLLVRTRYNFERQEIKARALINISNEQLQLQNKMIKQQKEEIEKKNTNIIEQNDALRIAKLSAEDASRSKADFLATMSHEIRTPLNGVIGLTHLLLDENPRPEQLEHLNALNFSAENLLTVVNDVLDYSKIEKGKIEFEEIDFSLKDVTKAIVRSLDYKAKEKGIQLVLKNDENLPEKINGDPTRLGQVLNNLLNNAIKFTDTGLVNLITKVVKSGDDKVDILFMVEDTGIGIPKDKQRLIFDRFTQSSSSTTRKYGGTGLGLSICKNLLSLKGVSLNLESEMGKGSKFFFTMDFKAVKVAKAAKEQVIIKDELAELKGFRVLVAEDNLLNQKIIAKFLMKWGMEYEVVENGMDAVQQVKKGGFDLVLMDLQMPEMDGLEATKMIRTLADEKQSDIPIIALTASAMLSVKADVKEAGMDDYISKPFNPTDLYRKISHCIDENANNDLGKKIILN
jgi:signal transduction histidine kinase/CheY-like chemotaxis protein